MKLSWIQFRLVFSQREIKAPTKLLVGPPLTTTLGRNLYQISFKAKA